MKGGVKDLKAFREHAQKAAKLAEKEAMDGFFERACSEMGARFLERVVPDTPAEENGTVYYDMGGALGVRHIKGGALRRGWKAGKVQSAGRLHEITVSNNVRYASYVEYGHRQNVGQFVPWLGKPDENGVVHGAALKRYKVDGQYFMTRAANALEDMSEGLAEKLVRDYISKRL